MMKTPYQCLECKEGNVVTVIEDYISRASDGNEIKVSDLELHRCEACGQTVVPRASAKKIKEAKSQQTDQLMEQDLYGFFEQSEMTQKEFAEALGLGEKTFHRWLKGTQVVSRSMGFYLRAMRQFPEVFEWVKSREWQIEAADQLDDARCQSSEDIFPALAKKSNVVMMQSNPALTLSSKVELTAN